MEKGYFAAAWGDVTKSPGWASVVLRLGLLCLIPIFGIVVMYGCFRLFQSSLTYLLACLPAFHLVAQHYMGRMCRRSLAP